MVRLLSESHSYTYIFTCKLSAKTVTDIAQIWTNWCNGSTGQLSAITLCLFALGSTARVFTSIQETGDRLLVVSCILATVCNYILVGQLFYYWNTTTSHTDS
ncbi:unnamed protein product [Trichobilharzia regenti]|nr:unnamed protein product [Trichobilharzia regenti]